MKVEHVIKKTGKLAIVLSSVVFALLAFIAYGAYQYKLLSREFDGVKTEFASSTAAFQIKVAQLEGELALARDEGVKLGSALEEEKGRAENLNSQLQTVSNTVTTLQKRITLDPELLQKYSKVFFLSENYMPTTLFDITNSGWVYQTGTKTFKLHTNVWPYLEKLVLAAKQEGIDLRILSAYRSFDDQSTLKANYKVVYGSGANQFSADQGYSEHQLGTTVDFTTPAIGSALEKFKATAGYPWLLANAHKYGFILSYPEGNAYYQFEPWHWRFVGTRLSTRLFEDKERFYDLDQRVIDQYLITIFD